jgi:uracil-DNA glycosylase
LISGIISIKRKTVEPGQILDQLAQQIRQCTNCPLSLTRKNAVPGEGPSNAQIMLIGEGPGYHENEQGRPFVGQAGKFLNELLNSGGLKREDVFITNVVKCRPPENRDPQESELAACSSYLDQQIAAINPLIILTLGRFSMARFFQSAKISSIHGRASWMDGRLIVAMYHPAAALHQPNLKADIMRDFSLLPGFIEKAHHQNTVKPVEQKPSVEEKPDASTQLTLF